MFVWDMGFSNGFRDTCGLRDIIVNYVNMGFVCFMSEFEDSSGWI